MIAEKQQRHCSPQDFSLKRNCSALKAVEIARSAYALVQAIKAKNHNLASLV